MKIIEEEYDLVGLGFGPANLALSIALCESTEAQELGLRFHFFEKQPAFGWHSSLLLPGAQLQVSPMKDLATMRDPTSSYTFTNYLHKQGRLASFINREASVPSRREWSAYLHWAAGRMQDVVTYGREVLSVEPCQGSTSAIQKWRLTMRDTSSGELFQCLANDITVGIGGIPVTPAPFEQLMTDQDIASSSFIAHSSAYLPALAAMEPRLRRKEAGMLAADTGSDTLSTAQCDLRAPLRFAVIGSGQSAAEISLHLRKTFATAHISLIFRASALVPSDDSAFVNAMAFDPERTDAHWRAGYEERATWLKEFRRTNYAVVRSDVLNELHTTVYDQDISFDQPWPNADGPVSHGKLRIRPNTQVDTVRMLAGSTDDADAQMVALTVRDLVYPTSKLSASLDDRTELFDAVFLATGFRRSPEHVPFLRPLQSLYPRLDPELDQKKAALGFAGEQDSFEALSMIVDDEMECERLRHRCRGITRDYRLVSYSSDAFDPPRGNDVEHRPTTNHRASSTSTPSLDSGTSTPQRDSDLSDSDTLADSDENFTTAHISRSNSRTRQGVERESDMAEQRLRGPKIEANIYFLGGNESSHGLSDSLLSIVAHRAGELTHSILQNNRNKRVEAKANASADAPHVVGTLRKSSTTLLQSVQQTMSPLRAT
jgi:lysine/ornithine N-monooxygenase